MVDSSGSSRRLPDTPHPGGRASSSERLFADDDAIDFAVFLENLADHRWLLVSIFAMCLLLAVAYGWSAEPIYEADALIRVEESGSDRFPALLRMAAPDQSGQSIASEVEILKARSTLARAVDKLGLQIGYEVIGRLPLIGQRLAQLLPRDDNGLARPLFAWNGIAWGGEELIIDAFEVPPADIGKAFELEAGANGSWRLLDESGKECLSGRVGDAFVDRGSGFALRLSGLRARPGNRFRLVRYDDEVRARGLAQSLAVSETARNASVVRLMFADPSPDRARHIVNAIADSYVERRLADRIREIRQSLDFLDKHLPTLRAKVDGAEDRLNAFRVKSGRLDISAETQALISASVDLEKRRFELDMQRRELALRVEPGHPGMQAIAEQLQALQAEAARLARRIGRLPGEQQVIMHLTRDVEVNSQLYLSLLNSAQQLRLAQAGTVAGASVVDYALRPDSPSRPRKGLIVVVGAFAGLLLGVLLPQVAARMRRSIREPQQAEAEFGLPVAAIVPFVREQASTPPPWLLAAAHPDHVAIEALRSLRVHLELEAARMGRTRPVIVSSPVPVQGKSFVASNLACVAATAGRRVLLVDADLRRPALRRYLSLPRGPGLADLLEEPGHADAVSFEQACAAAVLDDVFPNLSVLGTGAHVRSPAELLGHPNLESVLHWAQRNYDLVIVDTPPLLVSIDAELIARHAGEVLLVLWHKHVGVDDTAEAIGRVRRSGPQVPVSIVYNGFTPSLVRYGYGQYRYHGYRKYRKYKYAYSMESRG